MAGLFPSICLRELVSGILLRFQTRVGVDLILRDIPRRISDDEMGAAVLLAAAKLGTGLIFAAGLWDPVLQRI